MWYEAQLREHDDQIALLVRRRDEHDRTAGDDEASAWDRFDWAITERTAQRDALNASTTELDAVHATIAAAHAAVCGACRHLDRFELISRRLLRLGFAVVPLVFLAFLVWRPGTWVIAGGGVLLGGGIVAVALIRFFGHERLLTEFSSAEDEHVAARTTELQMLEHIEAGRPARTACH